MRRNWCCARSRWAARSVACRLDRRGQAGRRGAAARARSCTRIILRAALFHDEGRGRPKCGPRPLAREQDRYTAGPYNSTRRIRPLGPGALKRWHPLADGMRRSKPARPRSSSTRTRVRIPAPRGHMILMARPGGGAGAGRPCARVESRRPLGAATACEAHLLRGANRAGDRRLREGHGRRISGGFILSWRRPTPTMATWPRPRPPKRKCFASFPA